MRSSEYLIYFVAIGAAFWMAWWLFDNVHTVLGLGGIGVALVLILWTLEAIAVDLGAIKRDKRRR